ncbi:hypothetical protein AVEN_211817-1 [Araneus ventricosus]|uniref:Uncharacterized protein n=1 Tax=Araneus ventricosus TaxID=182803 RepID=A0A4Y2N4Q2_ARAVE|nr:hypothetical protein AVEN_211817-1 [Araneus ventricosus]
MVVDVTWSWNILCNTHNCRIRAAENPHAMREQSLHPDQVTVLLQYGVVLLLPLSLARIFLKRKLKRNPNLFRHRSTVPSYARDFELSQFQLHGCLQDNIFMQDGAPPRIDRRVKQLLRPHFTDARVISRHFPTA